MALTTLLIISGVALAGSGDPTFVPPNWHIHDGDFSSCPNPANPNDPWCQHKPIGFFWKTTGDGILNPNFPTLTDYQNDPARFPNATDTVIQRAVTHPGRWSVQAPKQTEVRI
jgi:hypothetical protein